MSFRSDSEIVDQYRALALESHDSHGTAAIGESAAGIARAAPRLPPLESLLAEAAVSRWERPPHAHTLAALVVAAARVLGEQGLHEAEPVLAKALLLQGLIATQCGAFHEAIPLLTAGAARCAALSERRRAIQGWGTLALLAGYRTDREASEAALARARACLHPGDALGAAFLALAEGQLGLFVQNRHEDAMRLLLQAATGFEGAGEQAEAIQAWALLAQAQRFQPSLEAAHASLLRAETIAAAHPTPVHRALCHQTAGLLHRVKDLQASIVHGQHAHNIYVESGMVFHAAMAALDIGVDLSQRRELDEAFRWLTEARETFARLGCLSFVGSCNFNLGSVCYYREQFAEASSYYQAVAVQARANNQRLRLAYSVGSMALCASRLGSYHRALALHQEELEIMAELGMAPEIARSWHHIGEMNSALGRWEAAEAAFHEATTRYAQADRPLEASRCATAHGELLLSLGRVAAAQAVLSEARQQCLAASLPVQAADCQRLLAESARRQGDLAAAQQAVDEAHARFKAAGLVVQAALCELVAGEIALDAGAPDLAVSAFEHAREQLAPFPDLVWRAEAGLARAAQAHNEPVRALAHLEAAIQWIGTARQTLPTERLSSDFFAARQGIFSDAIALALALEQIDRGLALGEAVKAQVSLTLLRQPGGRALDGEHNKRLTTLRAREAALRKERERLQRQIRLETQGPHQAATLRDAQVEALAELQAVSRDYDAVSEEIRLVAPGIALADPAPFALDAFRAAAQAHLPEGWCCLDYLLSDNLLTIFLVTADHCEVRRRTLAPLQRRLLERATLPTPDARHNAYGLTADREGSERDMQRLGDLLLPVDLIAWETISHLVIAPSGRLHALPFQALRPGGQLLLERVPVTYTPSLRVLQALWEQPTWKQTDAATLICGIGEFGDRAAPLHHTREEAEAVGQALGSPAWSDERAGVDGVKVFLGEHPRLALLHLATHAITDPLAPMNSRILLADGDLTMLDILHLSIQARLVTLSACQTLLSEVHAGDETITLAHAFLYAGARTVLASLWPVDDAATAVLMSHFVQRWRQGQDAGAALREAQLVLAQAGHPPYQWAAFILLGQP